MANFYSDPKHQFKWMLELANTDQTQVFLNSAAEDNKYISGLKQRLDDNPLRRRHRLAHAILYSEIRGIVATVQLDGERSKRCSICLTPLAHDECQVNSFLVLLIPFGAQQQSKPKPESGRQAMSANLTGC